MPDEPKEVKGIPKRLWDFIFKQPKVEPNIDVFAYLKGYYEGFEHGTIMGLVLAAFLFIMGIILGGAMW